MPTSTESPAPPRAVLDLRREPALWIALGVSVLQLVVAFIPGLGSAGAGLVDAAIVALGGFAVATLVRRDGQVAAAVGLVQAVLAALVGFGLAISPAQQAVVLAVVNAAGALFVRTQVQATIDELGRPR
jgi:hypothetical protein